MVPRTDELRLPVWQWRAVTAGFAKMTVTFGDLLICCAVFRQTFRQRPKSLPEEWRLEAMARRADADMLEGAVGVALVVVVLRLWEKVEQPSVEHPFRVRVSAPVVSPAPVLWVPSVYLFWAAWKSVWWD